MRRMHADEIDTDVDLVRRLLAAQFPQWADLPLSPVPSAGTDNALYRLGDDMVVRLPRIHWAIHQIDLEYEWLPRLAPLLPVALPVPLAKGEPAEGYPWSWSVYRWLDGANPVVGEVAEGLAADIVRFVAVLHRLDLAGAPPSGAGVPLSERDTGTRAAIDGSRGMVDTSAVTAAWEEAVRAPAWEGPPVLVHGDLAPGNLLTVDGRLSAVIDFSALGVGDPACDLIVAWNLLPAAARDTFRAGLGVDDATWDRGRGSALSKALMRLAYYHRTNPELAANARHVIAEVLADRRGAREPDRRFRQDRRVHPTDWLAAARIDPAVIALRPDYRALLVVADGLKPGPSDDWSEALLAGAERDAPPTEHPHAQAWADAFRAFGAKPQRTRPSLTALLRRAPDGLPRVDRLTDAYNAISVRHAVPVGGEDLDAYDGAIRLTRATGDEPFETVAAGEPVVEAPEPGEVVWRDDAGVTCRRWNWRQCSRTRLSPATTRAIFVLDALGPMDDAALAAAGEALRAALDEGNPGVRLHRRRLPESALSGPAFHPRPARGGRGCRPRRPPGQPGPDGRTVRPRI